MNELSLFSGAGGGLLGTHHLLGFNCIGYVEWDDYCQRVLAARIADGLIPCAPIFGDVREFVQSGAAREYRGFADVVSAGFPCQPHSVAGKRLGGADERDMWPATRDVIRLVRPKYVLLENVPGILQFYAATVIANLAALGYVCRWGCVSAAGEGAMQLRSRWWVVANIDDARLSQQQSPRAKQQSRPGPDRIPMQADWGTSDPSATFIRRGFPGIPNRVDRIKALGNAQIPRVVRAAWDLLK